MVQHAVLVRDLVAKDLLARYKTSSLGFFWSIINPAIMVVLFTLIFSGLLRVQPPSGVNSFALYVFSGFLPWFAVQEALVRCTTSVVDNSSLVKTVRFPIAVLPLYLVVSGIVNELIGIAILLPLAAYSQGAVSAHFLLIAPVLILQAMFCLGIGWILATLQVYMRDTIQILGVVLIVWMYLTPVFWPPSAVPAGYAFLLDFNPMYYLLSIYRALLLQSVPPPLGHILSFATMSLLTFYLGFGVIMRKGRSLPDMV